MNQTIKDPHPKPSNLRALARAAQWKGPKPSPEENLDNEPSKLTHLRKALVGSRSEQPGIAGRAWFAHAVGMPTWDALRAWVQTHETLWFGADAVPREASCEQMMAGRHAPAPNSALEAARMLAEHTNAAAERIALWREAQMRGAETIRLEPEGERPIEFTGIVLAEHRDNGKTATVYETLGGWIITAWKTSDSARIRVRQNTRPVAVSDNATLEAGEKHALIRDAYVAAGVYVPVKIGAYERKASDAVMLLGKVGDAAGFAPVVFNGRALARRGEPTGSEGSTREVTLYGLRSGGVALCFEPASGEEKRAQIEVHENAQALIERHERDTTIMGLCADAGLDIVRRID